MTTPTWGQPPQQPPVDPDAARKAEERRNQKIGCGCMGALAIAILIGIGSCAAANTTVTTTTSVATQQATQADTTEAAAPATTEPAASSSPADSTAVKVVAWWAGGGQDRANAIDNDFTAIGTDGSNQDVTSLGADCDKLSTDVESAQSYDPVPDAAAQSDWAQALADYHAGAADCTAGAAQQDASLISKASGELGDGNTQMGQLVTRIRQLGGNAG